ncbi:rhomboid family intramembrane serine protease [Arachidicoccus ginsenosidimutans]|uniref:rhomboid family intramembrane serine protease n=1 Tax=Arachidicoccus sp. BS20 TaxID=1850526 RepID=UPI0018D465BA|nr:rhomboid family intramembrane serine protease [Arachidicoccus sp. BS20]
MNSTLRPKHKISLGSSSNALVLLIAANAVLFVLLIFFKVFYFMTSSSNVADTTIDTFHREIFNYFILPSSFGQFIRQPWSLFSYMFTHESLLDLFSNLLWLVAFGYILQSLSGNKRLIPLYLYGGILGGIFFLIINAVLPQSVVHIDFLIGALPAVVAVAAGATTLTPQYRIFPMLGGGIPLWILFAVFMLVSVSSVANAGVAYVSTILFSALVGFYIIYQLKKGNDYGEWIYSFVHKIDSLFNPDKKYKQTKNESPFFYKTTRKPFETKEHVTQERVDEILDKINNKGYAALTKAEKELLKRAGEK